MLSRAVDIIIPFALTWLVIFIVFFYHSVLIDGRYHLGGSLILSFLLAARAAYKVVSERNQKRKMLQDEAIYGDRVERA